MTLSQVTVPITCAGATLDVRLFSTELFTPLEVEEYLALLRLGPTDRVLDIGANVGVFAVPAALRCAAVVAYEPDLANFAMLQANIACNAVANVTASPAAIVGGDAPAVSLFDGGSSTRHTLLPQAGGAARMVPAVNIDAALLASGANVVKLDAEGAEVGIIAGATRWSQVERLVLEYHDGLFGDWQGVLWASLRRRLLAVFPLLLERSSLIPATRLVYCTRRPDDLALARQGWPGPGWEHYARNWT